MNETNETKLVKGKVRLTPLGKGLVSLVCVFFFYGLAYFLYVCLHCPAPIVFISIIFILGMVAGIGLMIPNR